MEKRCFWTDLVKYMIVGVLSVAVQFIILPISVEFAGFNPTFSSGLAYVGASVVNYLLLYYWAFEATGKHWHIVFRYIYVSLATLVLNVVIFWILTVPLNIWYMESQFIAMSLIAFVNFTLNRHHTFY